MTTGKYFVQEINFKHTIEVITRLKLLLHWLFMLKTYDDMLVQNYIFKLVKLKLRYRTLRLTAFDDKQDSQLNNVFVIGGKLKLFRCFRVPTDRLVIDRSVYRVNGMYAKIPTSVV